MRLKHLLFAATSLMSLAAALASPLSPLAAHAAETPLRLTIAFTGDVSGYLEPCG